MFSDSVQAMNDTTAQNARTPEDNVVATGSRDDLRLRVLRALEANPELSQRQLAAELGVSLGGVNYALKTLIGRGYVKVRNSVRANKNAYLCV